MAYGTMEKIETVTVGAGGTAAIDFTNIPQTYDDLAILYSFRASPASDYIDTSVQLNNTNSSNGRVIYVISGTNVGSYVPSAAQSFFALSTAANNTASIFSNGSVYIPNYKSSTNKSLSSDNVGENNGTNTALQMSAGLYAVTSAVTSVKFTPSSGTIVQHSTATLYGITRVPAGAKATGGVIYDDSSYWYHVFTSSGTFTPNQSITVDVLVVAGGGAGGRSYGGGGGAGGLLGLTGQTVSTAQTITVGAGGAAQNTSSFRGNNGNNSQFGSLTAAVGGGGGGYDAGGGTGATGNTGGSGGGGSRTYSGGVGTTGQGNRGGNISGGANAGAGGGGAGAAGGDSSSTQTAGGVGSSSYSSWGLATYTGQNVSGTVYYAGGGGGQSAAGGLGGGGQNLTGQPGYDSSGTINTGGGAGADSTVGSGGSGIVIVRYAK